MRTETRLWISMVASVLMYGVIVVYLTDLWPVTKTVNELMSDLNVIVLSIVAFTALVMSFVVFPQIHARKNDSSAAAIRQTLIMRWAAIEAVAAMGLVATFLTRDQRPFMAFGAVALVAFLLTFPSEERLSTL